MRWKEINEFEKYQVSETGQVKSLHRGKDITLKPEVDKDGYHIYDLSINGQKQRKKAHRLVAEAFLSNVSKLPVVNHLNGIKNDNRLENLEWCTYFHNTRHAIELGLLETYARGIKILDIHKNEIVSYFHGYDQLAKITGLKKLSLIDICYNNKLLFEGYRIIRENCTDYSREPLFEKNFFQRTISGRFKPILWDNKVYTNVIEFRKINKISSRNFTGCKKEAMYNGKTIIFISHYDYVTYK